MDDNSSTIAKLVNQNLSQIVQAIKQAFPLSGNIGSFTMGAGSPSTVVSTSQIKTGTYIGLMPTSASAAVAMCYVSSTSVGTSFTVSTGAGGNAAGTEAFNYIIVNLS
jgi:hypothetical protein